MGSCSLVPPSQAKESGTLTQTVPGSSFHGLAHFTCSKLGETMCRTGPSCDRASLSAKNKYSFKRLVYPEVLEIKRPTVVEPELRTEKLTKRGKREGDLGKQAHPGQNRLQILSPFGGRNLPSCNQRPTNRHRLSCVRSMKGCCLLNRLLQNTGKLSAGCHSLVLRFPSPQRAVKRGEVSDSLGCSSATAKKQVLEKHLQCESRWRSPFCG